MKTLKNTNKSTFIIIGILLLCLWSFYWSWKNEIVMKEQVGNEVVIKKDTLLIINYSYFDNTYTLENGMIVSVELINKFNQNENSSNR